MTAPQSVDDEPSRLTPQAPGAHVLVVEDSPDHRMLIVRALRGAGHEVTTAGSAEQALERLGDGSVDVALIDQRLPRMSGADLLAALVGRPDAPACVVVTGAGSQELVVEALRLGAVDYVVKSPEYLGDLPAVVARAHRQHDLARRYRELQRFALMVHEPEVREDIVDEIVVGAHRLLRAHGVVLARQRSSGGWVSVASSGEVADPDRLLRWLDARDRGLATPRTDDLVVDLPQERDEGPGALVLTPRPGTRFLAEEAQLATTLASFAASALRQVRRLELERDLVDELQQAVRAREDFLASVSHELRTPLTVITGYVETLRHRDDLDDDMRVHLMDRVLRNAGELRRLIDQLLDVASLERGREVVPWPERVDLADVVEEALEEAAIHLEGRDGTRVVGPLAVRADPALVRRTLVNLLSNAGKYSPAGAPVDVEATVVGGEVRVAVTDRGIGVPAASRARVFEPFWRGPTAVADAIRGTGIGLALVREYVEALGGRVGIDDAPGGGSVFWFTVPWADAHPGAVGGPGEPGGSLDLDRTDP